VRIIKIRSANLLLLIAALVLCGCSRAQKAAAPEADGPTLIKTAASVNSQTAPPTAPDATVPKAPAGEALGFDRNDYPGDDAMANLHKTFAFTSYWLTNPPGENANSWLGKRATLLQQGWGFLLLADGRFDKEILTAQKSGTAPVDLGRRDAAIAIAAAVSEGFPHGSILFLDQEEGGRLLDEQAAYLLGWTEAVARSTFRPGVYASGERVQDDPGVMIDTIEDIRQRINKGHLHNVEFFDALDKCPPAPGCTLQAKPLSAAGEPNLIAWQYSQTPRRPEITQSCAATYAPDNRCYAPNNPGVFLDMDIANSPDPSHAR
jgi:hypothetical protein